MSFEFTLLSFNETDSYKMDLRHTEIPENVEQKTSFANTRKEDFGRCD